MSKQFTPDQARAFADVCTLMSLLVDHPEYKTIKNILLDLNKFIMAHESKPANIRRWKKQMQELLEEDPEMKEIVFGQPRSSVYSMKFGGDDD